jgi:hypothetical protein
MSTSMHFRSVLAMLTIVSRERIDPDQKTFAVALNQVNLNGRIRELTVKELS